MNTPGHWAKRSFVDPAIAWLLMIRWISSPAWRPNALLNVTTGLYNIPLGCLYVYIYNYVYIYIIICIYIYRYMYIYSKIHGLFTCASHRTANASVCVPQPGEGSMPFWGGRVPLEPSSLTLSGGLFTNWPGSRSGGRGERGKQVVR
jgi:hypothetical protein